MVQKVCIVLPPVDQSIHFPQATDNIINDKNGGYENVEDYIPIGQPNSGTLAKLDALQPSDVTGDRK